MYHWEVPWNNLALDDAKVSLWTGEEEREGITYHNTVWFVPGITKLVVVCLCDRRDYQYPSYKIEEKVGLESDTRLCTSIVFL